MTKLSENSKAYIETSSLTCPKCEVVQADQLMPTNACQYFWDCPACKAVIKPLKGDCCVYCSYGTQKCPPVQLHGKGSCCD